MPLLLSDGGTSFSIAGSGRSPQLVVILLDELAGLVEPVELAELDELLDPLLLQAPSSRQLMPTVAVTASIRRERCAGLRNMRSSFRAGVGCLSRAVSNAFTARSTRQNAESLSVARERCSSHLVLLKA